MQDLAIIIITGGDSMIQYPYIYMTLKQWIPN